MTVAEIVRRSQSAATMTKKLRLAILTSLGAICFAVAQDSPAPAETTSPTPEQTPSPSPSASTVRTVQLRFVPPPMEGTISLGIFDSNDKLVRVLHREAKVDNFTIDENALKTTWDGKNDAGEDLPPGKYRARGYLVGNLKVEHLEKLQTMPTDVYREHISVRLVINPLTSDTRAIMDIAVTSNGKGCFLITTDGLPLLTISTAANVPWASIEKNDEKSADIWLGAEGNIEHLRVSNIDKMMAFDCGFFELK